jgi:ankyrin repeat protein
MMKLRLTVIIFLSIIGSSSVLAQDIFEAVRAGDLAKVKVVLEKNPDLLNAMDMKKTPGHTLIHFAASYGHTDVIAFFLEKGVDINIRTPFNETPLHLAAQNGRKDAVGFFMAHKAELNLKNRWGDTPVFRAASRGHSEIVALFLKNGVNVNTTARDEKTLLHVVSSSGYIDLARLLISKGINVNSTNAFGQTPLHLAAFHGHEEVVELLLKKGANSDWKGLDGRSAFHYAELGGHKEVIQLLISEGSNTSSWEFPVLKGKYLDQELPGRRPEIFAPGIISTDGNEFAGTFSPDGNEFYYTANGGVKQLKMNTILVTKHVDGRWSEPEVAPISGGYFDFEPHITVDGTKLYFGSRRPMPGEDKPGGVRLWVSERVGADWSDPQPATQFFPDASIIYPSVAQDGTVYYTGRDSTGKHGIYVSRLERRKYQTYVRLGEEINFHFSVHHSYIAPDESYLIFDAQPQLQGPELYISFRRPDGTWTKSVRFGDEVNATGTEMCGFVSPDGRFFFFSREGNVYWMDAKVIEELKPEELKKRE